MKATGIVRRIDDLGRVVIPKEIRRTMRIREGAPLEIFTNKDGEVIFKKYSPIGEISEYVDVYAETVNRGTANTAIVSDKDTILSVSGEKNASLRTKSSLPRQKDCLKKEKPMFTGSETRAYPFRKARKTATRALSVR